MSAPCRSTGSTGVRLDLICAPPTPAVAFPSVIGRPGSDFIAARMEPVGASTTNERDSLSGEAGDVSIGESRQVLVRNRLVGMIGL